MFHSVIVCDYVSPSLLDLSAWFRYVTYRSSWKVLGVPPKAVLKNDDARDTSDRFLHVDGTNY